MHALLADPHHHLQDPLTPVSKEGRPMEEGMPHHADWLAAMTRHMRLALRVLCPAWSVRESPRDSNHTQCTSGPEAGVCGRPCEGTKYYTPNTHKKRRSDMHEEVLGRRVLSRSPFAPGSPLSGESPTPCLAYSQDQMDADKVEREGARRHAHDA